MDRCFCKNKTGCPELWSTFLPGYQAQNEPRRFDISISNAVGLQDNALDTSHQDEFRNNGENRCRKQDKSGGDAAYDNHTPNRTPKLDRDRGYPIRGPRFPYRAVIRRCYAGSRGSYQLPLIFWTSFSLLSRVFSPVLPEIACPTGKYAKKVLLNQRNGHIRRGGLHI